MEEEDHCAYALLPPLNVFEMRYTACWQEQFGLCWRGDRLNEGHTVFIERKIAGRIFGEQLRHFLALDGWTELRNQVY